MGYPLSGCCAVKAPVAFAPALFGAAALSAPNAPLDAARLDIMPAGLWGRAESIRGVLRALAIAAAPLLFGWPADRLGGGANGIRGAFLIMLVPLACSSLVLWRARRSYPEDMARAGGAPSVAARQAMPPADEARAGSARSFGPAAPVQASGDLSSSPGGGGAC